MERTKDLKRDSRIELVRIIATLMILFHHIIQHSGDSLNVLIKNSISGNQIISVILGSWGQLGVTLFIIISSWFFAGNPNQEKSGGRVHFLNIVRLVIHTWFICIAEMAVGYCLGIDIPKEVIIKEIVTPVYPEQYWFVTTYIVFYLTIPFVRTGISFFSRERLRSICIMLWIFVPIYNVIYRNVGGDLAYFYTVFFTTYYLKHDKQSLDQFEKMSKKILGCLFLVNFVLTELFCYLGSKESSVFFKIVNKFIDCDNILIFIMAFCIFCIFAKMPCFEIKWINTMAKASLGTYLITENYMIKGTFRISFWDEMFNIYAFYYNSTTIKFVIGVLGVVLIVYALCILIELVLAQIENSIYKKCTFLSSVCDSFDAFFYSKTSK